MMTRTLTEAFRKRKAPKSALPQAALTAPNHCNRDMMPSTTMTIDSTTTKADGESVREIVHILAPHRPSILHPSEAAILADNATRARECVGIRDKRNVGRSDAFAVGIGYRSGQNGYAQGASLRWILTQDGNSGASLEDLLDHNLAYKHMHQYRRCPIPVRRKAHDLLLAAAPELHVMLREHTAAVVADRRAVLLSHHQANVEASTRKFSYVDTHPSRKSWCQPEVFPGVSPGISGMTLNFLIHSPGQYGTDQPESEPVATRSTPPPLSTPHYKPYLNTMEPSKWAWKDERFWPTAKRHKQGKVHKDDNDWSESLGHLALWTHDERSCETPLLGGECCMRVNGQVLLVGRCANSVIASFDTIDHVAAATEPRGVISEDDRAQCGSLVCQVSRIVANSTRLCINAEGKAFAVNAAQKSWLMLQGVIPVTNNEQKRPSWAWLIKKVEKFPINLPKSEVTANMLMSYFVKANSNIQEFYKLSSDVEGLGEGEGEDEDEGEGDDEGDDEG